MQPGHCWLKPTGGRGWVQYVWDKYGLVLGLDSHVRERCCLANTNDYTARRRGSTNNQCCLWSCSPPCRARHAVIDGAGGRLPCWYCRMSEALSRLALDLRCTWQCSGSAASMHVHTLGGRDHTRRRTSMAEEIILVLLLVIDVQYIQIEDLGPWDVDKFVMVIWEMRRTAEAMIRESYCTTPRAGSL